MEGSPILRDSGRLKKTIGETIKKDLALYGLPILYRHDL